ncbi:hypothetical protein JQM84_05390 [Parabacteroides distasonis]|nr:hypothetical protein [Parabacteroides distasonis]MCI6523017.1 hypothetical protein [Parabacteroides sp.]
MNGKIYIFCIGGTGSRVLRSLTMLAAAGVRTDASSIVPIIVDPDFANADVTRTINSMKIYAGIRENLAFNAGTKNDFFNTHIENVLNDYRLPIRDTKNKRFQEFIEYSTLSKENQALASILFSEKNLDADMEVGFKGNPNMGSVVLNQFLDSQEFVNFCASFKTNDRIFIVSSIFGGTGASGFPLLLKTLRGLPNNMPNCQAIRNAPIGAITVLPYFAIKPDETSEINSSTFIGKTKAALQYYEKNVNGNESSVNVLYYIGDNRNKQYENQEGGDEQRNNAHLVEVAAALSIVDFSNIKDDSVMTCCLSDSGKVYAPNPLYKEFGIEEDVQQVLCCNLSKETSDQIMPKMTQLLLLAKYIHEHANKAIEQQPWAKDNKIDNAYIKAPFYDRLNKFLGLYVEWLEELQDNDRSFKPFNITVSGKDLFTIVAGIEPSKIRALWALNKNGYDLFDAILNRVHGSLPHGISLDQKLIELFNLVTYELVKNKLKLM